jgi:hypothetical protein
LSCSYNLTLLVGGQKEIAREHDHGDLLSVRRR